MRVVESPGSVLRPTLTRSRGKPTGLHSRRSGAPSVHPAAIRGGSTVRQRRVHYHLMLALPPDSGLTPEQEADLAARRGTGEERHDVPTR